MDDMPRLTGTAESDDDRLEAIVAGGREIGGYLHEWIDRGFPDRRGRRWKGAGIIRMSASPPASRRRPRRREGVN
jgi:hypothetical protein